MQNGANIQAAIPSDPVKALAGYYILFAMVDDIPSIGKIVRITPAPAARPAAIQVRCHHRSSSGSGASDGPCKGQRL